MDVKPGDTVEVTVTIKENPNSASSIECELIVPNVLERVKGKPAFVNYEDGGAVAVGESKTVVYKVKDTAPDGKYTIEDGAIDAYAKLTPVGGVKIQLSNNTFTVKSNSSPATCSHSWGEWKVTKAPNCTQTGAKERTCSKCGEVEKETLPKDASAHNWGDWITTKAATCTEKGTETRTCKLCSKTETRDIKAKGHDWGDWETTKEPQVGVAGEETRICKNDPSHKETRPIDALDPSVTTCTHEKTTAREKTAATGTKDGVQEYVCDQCGKVIKTEKIPALGHDWSEWKIIKDATCTEAGTQERECARCHEKETEAIPAKGHDWTDWADSTEYPGHKERHCKNDAAHVEYDPELCPHTNISWKKLKTAGCTTEGESEYSCDDCGKVFETNIIPPTGHDQGEWVTVKEVTKTEDGLKQLQCTRCGEVLKEEIIPHVVTEIRYNQSVCSLGIRFRDVNPNLTNKWFMFTPIDLSKDGTQSIDLIAANITYVGKASVKVSGDQVTVTYHLNWPVEITDMRFTLLPDIASVNSADFQNMKAYSFGQAISIANDLGGDTKVLLYVFGHINYDFKDTGKELFVSSGAGYQNLVKQLKDLMD